MVLGPMPMSQHCFRGARRHEARKRQENTILELRLQLGTSQLQVYQLQAQLSSAVEELHWWRQWSAEFPQVETVKKIVEVPQKQPFEKAVPVSQVSGQEQGVPTPRAVTQQVVKQNPVPKAAAVEQFVETPQVQMMERVVPVPQVTIQEMPRPGTRVMPQAMKNIVAHVKKFVKVSEPQAMKNIAAVPHVPPVENIVQTPAPVFKETIAPTREEVIRKNNCKDYEFNAKFVCGDCAMLYDEQYKRCCMSGCSGRIVNWKSSSSYSSYMRLFHDDG